MLRDRERLAREISLLSLVLRREIRQNLVSLSLTEDLSLEQLQQRGGRVYAIAFVFHEDAEKMWRGLFDDLEIARPPVFGLTVPVAVAHPQERAFDHEVPLVLPLTGASFPQIAEIKNELFGAAARFS